MKRQAEPAITTATERVRPNFHRKWLLQGLAAWYAVVWLVSAYHPFDWKGWLLENLLVFVLVAVLASTYRKFPLSDMSYLLLTVFLTFHAIGAHYTYTKVPIGFWVQDWLNLSRNHYDRFVHFCFGLLLAYPIREVFLRVAKAKGFWAYYLPLDVTLAFSGLFEIVEMLIALMVNPELGNAYLGAQGDEWDAQKDMLAAMTGAIICMALTAWLHHLLNKSDRVKSGL